MTFWWYKSSQSVPFTLKHKTSVTKSTLINFVFPIIIFHSTSRPPLPLQVNMYMYNSWICCIKWTTKMVQSSEDTKTKHMTREWVLMWTVSASWCMYREVCGWAETTHSASEPLGASQRPGATLPRGYTTHSQHNSLDVNPCYTEQRLVIRLKVHLRLYWNCQVQK